MVTGPLLLVIFVVSIALLLALIIRWRVNPFLALLITTVLTALTVRMPLGEIGDAIATGFGNTLGGIGIVIALGIVLGNLMVGAGAMDQIAKRLLDATGDRHSPLALNATGYFSSIPVFIDAAFVIFTPLAGRISKQTGRPWILFVTALAVGLIVTHSMVVPTPGPLAVVANMGADIGFFLLYGIIASIPAALVGGWLYGLYLEQRPDGFGSGPPLAEEKPAEARAELPSAGLSFWVLLLPVLLILIGSVFGLLLVEGAWYRDALLFIGDKNVALLIGVLAAIFVLRRFIQKTIREIVSESAAAAGIILLITGAGGAFGHVINESGIGSYLVDTLTAWHISMLVLGFVLAAILRAAQGSVTVSLITTSAILGPTVIGTDASAILVGLAICAGGMCVSLPNDSAFWVVSRFANITVRDTLRSWTIGGTIAGIVAFGVVLLLSLFSAFLPGL